MSDELKACPVCGGKPGVSHELSVDDHVSCANPDCWLYGLGFHIDDWQNRPLEDALQARVEELEAENAILTAELAELNNKAVFIQFENEDELPADISSDIYSAMFNCSHVDVVRLFPYIKENGQKYYLVMLREDE